MLAAGIEACAQELELHVRVEPSAVDGTHIWYVFLCVCRVMCHRLRGTRRNWKEHHLEYPSIKRE